MKTEIVILAAGLGKRMHSALPKVLHQVAGRSMLSHVIAAARALNPYAVHIVSGHKSELIEAEAEKYAEGCSLHCHKQEKQLGTANAVAAAADALTDDSITVVLYADTPLTPVSEVQALCAELEAQQADLALLTCELNDPTGYGRILRSEDGQVTGIVEEKDCTDEQRQIREINTGIIAVKSALLKQYLPRIGCNNAQGEYYLTDLTGLLAAAHFKVISRVSRDFALLRGVNNKQQLAEAERTYQLMQAKRLMTEGVTLTDPARFDLRGSLEHGDDVFIDINCVFEGQCVLGSNVHIGAGCVIKDCVIEDNSVISPYSVLESSHLKKHNTIGPFARLRPGNTLEDEVHVGNFVELKKAHLGYGTKAGHLSYLGDSEIGRDVNIGAGTITCNYDGANKHQTVIGDDVFVGSDTQLVAPVTVESGATIAAGTTVTRRVPANALVLTRVRPGTVIRDYQRPRKDKK